MIADSRNLESNSDIKCYLTLRYLLRLSKKSKWPVLAVSAMLKIGHLWAEKERESAGFRVFRQAGYLSPVQIRLDILLF